MKEKLNFTILQLGNYHFQLYNLLLFIFIVLVAFAIQALVKKGIYRMRSIDISKKYAFFKLFQYVFWVSVALLSLQSLSINITVLLAGSAALLVGFGLGMQQIFSDFVSGIIILLDSTIKVNDIIEVNNKIFKVVEINFRTTTVIGREENYVILPNSELTKNVLTNWTYDNVYSRFRIDIGVDYSSDAKLVMELLIEAVQEQSEVMKDRPIFARFQDFGDSSLDFSVYFWSEEIFKIEQVKQDIRLRILDVFRTNNISIPFPQRDVHLKNRQNEK